MTISTVISNANLLKKRRNIKRKENTFSPLTANYGKHFFRRSLESNDWYCKDLLCPPHPPQKMETCQSSSVCIPTDIWAAGMPFSTHPRPRSAASPGTHWLASRGLQDRALGSHRKKSSVPPFHVPSILQRASTKEGHREIYCRHLWALRHLQRRSWMRHMELPVTRSTFRTAATPGWRPGSPGYAQDIRPRPKDALLGLLRGNILSLVVKNIQKYLLSKLFDFWYSGAIYHENDSS